LADSGGLREAVAMLPSMLQCLPPSLTCLKMPESVLGRQTLLFSEAALHGPASRTAIRQNHQQASLCHNGGKAHDE
jgi:hypothetical protein